MSQELLYQIALTLVPNIGPVQAKILIQHFKKASAIFSSHPHQLKHIEGIGEIRALNICRFNDFSKAEKEIAFIKNNNIQPLFITDPQYPQRLLHCYDPPTLLFYKGNADLNASKTVAIVGTRNNTEYGKQQTEKLIKELSAHSILIISGLAWGIDAIAHKTACRQQLPTVGVLAHGLDQLYPPQHLPIAKEMLSNGGLLTEFRSGTSPDKHNFPARNRIVAGMCDVTIVIETGIKGGSMITAELANGYNRDVFAIPGRITDAKSSGCHTLIRNNKAVLLTEPAELIESMGWNEKKINRANNQKSLFIEMTGEERVIVDLLLLKESMHIDEINLCSNLSSSAIAAAMLNLELQNVIISLPGKIYQLA